MVSKFRKNKKPGFNKNIIFTGAAIIVFLIIIVILINANIKINKRRAELFSQIEFLEKEIASEQGSNQELEKGVSKAESREYLEKVVREELGYKKPGEKVVVITEEEESSFSSDQGTGDEKKNFWNPKYWWEWLKQR